MRRGMHVRRVHDDVRWYKEQTRKREYEGERVKERERVRTRQNCDDERTK